MNNQIFAANLICNDIYAIQEADEIGQCEAYLTLNKILEVSSDSEKINCSLLFLELDMVRSQNLQLIYVTVWCRNILRSALLSSLK